MATENLNVYNATLEDMRNFYKYVSCLEISGIAKIIPPKEWSPNTNYNLDNITLSEAIEQELVDNDDVISRVYEKEKISVDSVEKSTQFLKSIYSEKDNSYDLFNQKTDKIRNPKYGIYNGSLFNQSFNFIFDHDPLQKTFYTYPGVNSPKCYFSEKGSIFGIHCEDHNLGSISYLHEGSSKKWYGYDHHKNHSFHELIIGQIFKNDDYFCPGFIQHKELLLNPKFLKITNNKYDYIEQNQGEFVVTSPGAYHWGFNCGFNIEEAINFTNDVWSNNVKDARTCICFERDHVILPLAYIAKFYDVDLDKVKRMKTCLACGKSCKEPKNCRTFLPNGNGTVAQKLRNYAGFSLFDKARMCLNCDRIIRQ